jgi:hypothetical protein
VYVHAHGTYVRCVWVEDIVYMMRSIVVTYIRWPPPTAEVSRKKTRPDGKERDSVRSRKKWSADEAHGSDLILKLLLLMEHSRTVSWRRRWRQWDATFDVLKGKSDTFAVSWLDLSSQILPTLLPCTPAIFASIIYAKYRRAWRMTYFRREWNGFYILESCLLTSPQLPLLCS